MYGKNLCLISYNSRGYDTCKQNFTKMLSTLTGCSLTIICNQENFLLKNNDYIVKKSLPDHHIVFKPALKKGLNGRPKNGMVIAVPKLLQGMIKDVSPQSYRIQSIILTLQPCKILIINTYFPTDPQTSDLDESELLMVISEVRRITENNDFDQIIWTGDMNADFRRNTKFVSIINEFIEEMNIYKFWDKYHVDFTHLTDINNISYTSIIDHFFWNSRCDKLVSDAGVIHLPDNMSDHSPIFCKFNVPNGNCDRVSSGRSKKVFPQ